MFFAHIYIAEDRGAWHGVTKWLNNTIFSFILYAKAYPANLFCNNFIWSSRCLLLYIHCFLKWPKMIYLIFNTLNNALFKSTYWSYKDLGLDFDSTSPYLCNLCGLFNLSLLSAFTCGNVLNEQYLSWRFAVTFTGKKQIQHLTQSSSFIYQ